MNAPEGSFAVSIGIGLDLRPNDVGGGFERTLL